MQTLFIGNISFDATEEHLEKLFEQHGELLSVVIKYNREGDSRGYGFVQMMDSQEAEVAQRELNGFILMGRALDVQYENK